MSPAFRTHDALNENVAGVAAPNHLLSTVKLVLYNFAGATALEERIGAATMFAEFLSSIAATSVVSLAGLGNCAMTWSVVMAHSVFADRSPAVTLKLSCRGRPSILLLVFATLRLPQDTEVVAFAFVTCRVPVLGVFWKVK
jgi:hypothetical protein